MDVPTRPLQPTAVTLTTHVTILPDAMVAGVGAASDEKYSRSPLGRSKQSVLRVVVVPEVVCVVLMVLLVISVASSSPHGIVKKSSTFKTNGFVFAKDKEVGTVVP